LTEHRKPRGAHKKLIDFIQITKEPSTRVFTHEASRYLGDPRDRAAKNIVPHRKKNRKEGGQKSKKQKVSPTLLWPAELQKRGGGLLGPVFGFVAVRGLYGGCHRHDIGQKKWSAIETRQLNTGRGGKLKSAGDSFCTVAETTDTITEEKPRSGNAK